MPIYNFSCQDCGRELEMLIRNRDEKVRCTSCGGSDVKRVYSSFDFSLKKDPAPACQSGTCTSGTCGMKP